MFSSIICSLCTHFCCARVSTALDPLMHLISHWRWQLCHPASARQIHPPFSSRMTASPERGQRPHCRLVHLSNQQWLGSYFPRSLYEELLLFLKKQQTHDIEGKFSVSGNINSKTTKLSKDSVATTEIPPVPSDHFEEVTMKRRFRTVVETLASCLWAPDIVEWNICLTV